MTPSCTPSVKKVRYIMTTLGVLALEQLAVGLLTTNIMVHQTAVKVKALGMILACQANTARSRYSGRRSDLPCTCSFAALPSTSQERHILQIIASRPILQGCHGSNAQCSMAHGTCAAHNMPAYVQVAMLTVRHIRCSRHCLRCIVCMQDYKALR